MGATRGAAPEASPLLGRLLPWGRMTPPEGEEQSDAEAGAAEIALVAALRAGSAEAHRTFEARYLAPLRGSLGGLRLSDAELDDVKQRTREKLLVPDASGALRVEAYAGKGRLGGLVRVVATREAVSLRRRTAREIDLDGAALADPLGRSWDPGIELLKARTREAFVAAFETAVRRLTSRERTLLRLHLLGGVTLEKLAEMYSVHRATIVRWLAAAREKVLDGTRAGMAASLEVGGPELESLMDAIRQSLDVSVERMLASMAPDHQF